MISLEQFEKLKVAFVNKDYNEVHKIIYDIEKGYYNKGFDDGYDACKDDIEYQKENNCLF